MRSAAPGVDVYKRQALGTDADALFSLSTASITSRCWFANSALPFSKLPSVLTLVTFKLSNSAGTASTALSTSSGRLAIASAVLP